MQRLIYCIFQMVFSDMSFVVFAFCDAKVQKKFHICKCFCILHKKSPINLLSFCYFLGHKTTNDAKWHRSFIARLSQSDKMIVGGISTRPSYPYPIGDRRWLPSGEELGYSRCRQGRQWCGQPSKYGHTHGQTVPSFP